MNIIRFQVDSLKVEIYPDSKSAAAAAAEATAQALQELSRQQDLIAVYFATGASQLHILEALVTREDVPWNKIIGFHLDEYVGIDPNHPASFRRYLRENLTSRVPLHKFHEIDGNTQNPEAFCADYARTLNDANPQLCLLGIGENGHLAFNDPGVADFSDPKDIKVVLLDSACREQQTAEGWFPTREDVPERAMTLTIPTLFRVPKLILSVPGKRKAQIVKEALLSPITEQCPATIIRRHPDATVYLDADSASILMSNGTFKSTWASAGNLSVCA